MERGFEIALDGRPEEVELSKVIEITKEVDLPSDYTVLDFETTGFKPETSKIIQVGAIRYRNDEKISEFSSFVYVDEIPEKITKLTGIRIDQCECAPELSDIMPQLLKFIGSDIIVAHNAPFDLAFLTHYMKELKIPSQIFAYVDTLKLARKKIVGVQSYKLPTLKKFLRLDYASHLADQDCYVCHEVYKYCRGIVGLSNPLPSPLEFVPAESLIDHKPNCTIELETRLNEAKDLENQNKIDEAISLYEECVQMNCLDKTPYDRLILLYRKKRQKEDEIRILNLAITRFVKENKYQIRLSKIVV